MLRVFPLICKVLYNYYYKSVTRRWGNADPFPRESGSHCLLSGWTHSYDAQHWRGRAFISEGHSCTLRNQAEKLVSGPLPTCPLGSSTQHVSNEGVRDDGYQGSYQGMFLPLGLTAYYLPLLAAWLLSSRVCTSLSPFFCPG